jgi:hypothetical protein
MNGFSETRAVILAVRCNLRQSNALVREFTTANFHKIFPRCLRKWYLERRAKAFREPGFGGASNMLKKFAMVLVALATVGAAAVPTTASARGWGRGGGGWGRGRGWGWGPAVGVGIGLGVAAGYPYYGGGYGYGAYGPGPYGCWRTARVGTPYGWRWRRVWVC